MFNKLSDAQLERLAILAEECGEVQQAIGKILRHGYDSSHPNLGEGDNRYKLVKEIGDILAIVDVMTEESDIDSIQLDDRRYSKRKRLENWTRYQKFSKLEKL